MIRVKKAGTVDRELGATIIQVAGWNPAAANPPKQNRERTAVAISPVTKSRRDELAGSPLGSATGCRGGPVRPQLLCSVPKAP